MREGVRLSCFGLDVVAAMLARSEQLDSQGLGLWVIEQMRECFAGIAGLQPVSAVAGRAMDVLAAWRRLLPGTPVVVTKPDGIHASIYRDVAARVWDGLQSERAGGGKTPPKIVVE